MKKKKRVPFILVKNGVYAPVTLLALWALVQAHIYIYVYIFYIYINIYIYIYIDNISSMFLGYPGH